jgi:hypothetical protein
MRQTRLLGGDIEGMVNELDRAIRGTLDVMVGGGGASDELCKNVLLPLASVSLILRGELAEADRQAAGGADNEGPVAS